MEVEAAVLSSRQVCFTKVINAAHISELKHFPSQSAPAQLPVELCQDSMLLHHFGLMLFVDAVLPGTKLCACLLVAFWIDLNCFSN